MGFGTISLHGNNLKLPDPNKPSIFQPIPDDGFGKAHGAGFISGIYVRGIDKVTPALNESIQNSPGSFLVSLTGPT